MMIVLAILISAMLASAITYFVVRKREEVIAPVPDDEPPRAPVAVAVDQLGGINGLGGATFQCNQWIELWTNAIEILDGPTDIADISNEQIFALVDETTAKRDAATASTCNGTGCFQVVIGPDNHAFNVYETPGGTHVLEVFRQTWFRCIAPM